MEILLLEKIKKLGNQGDKVKVKKGYARNFLFPKKKAVIANKKNIDLFEQYKTKVNIKISEELKRTKEIATKISKLNSITIFSKVGNQGKLFGSVNKLNIANAITKLGIPINKHQIRLPHGIIKNSGKHEIYIYFQKGISEKIFINVEKKHI